ncbi:MAG: GEVED domain-containing protein [Crocinitomicaceae bacterium]|nr:GEVED domain-containing protein [Crocinitomicaceae bacterium]
MKLKLLGLGLMVGLLGHSQISEGGKPTSFVRVAVGDASPYQTYYQTVTVPSPNMDEIHAEDATVGKERYRVAINTPVDVNILSHGNWHEMPTGDKIWRVAIESPGAEAVGLYFAEDVQIPLGGKLHAYNEKQSQYIGAYTSNTPAFKAMEMIQGDVIILEYFQPAGSTELPIIHVESIAHFYRGVENRIAYFRDGSTQNEFRAHGSCQVDVECSEGDSWTNQVNSVVHYSFSDGSGTYVCSGSVVNNTNTDCTPFILTANHCGEPASSSDISSNVWYFNYQRPSCVPGNTSKYTGALSETMTGGIFRASSSYGDHPASFSYQVDGSDFALVEMSTDIPASYDPYFAGWSRATGASSSGVGIHHPSGDEKKISTYSSNLVSATYNSGWTGAHWRVQWVSTTNGHGVTEGGSSGSPIFNSSGLIVGFLSGGSSFCSAPTDPDLYGKFDRAWDQESSSTNAQLKHWLDPAGTNPTSLTGTSMPCAPAAPVADFVASATTVTPGTTVTFTDLSTGGPTSWSWSISPATGWSYTGGTSASSQNPQVNFTDLGTYTVALTATNATGSDTETKTTYITVSSVSGPCPATGNDDCSAGTENEYIAEVSLSSIDNASNCSEYTDYTSISTSVTRGSSYDVTVVPNIVGNTAPSAYTNDEIAVWIDFNKDMDFDDAGEQVGYVLVSGTISTTFSFTVPTTTELGDVIMRTRISYQPEDGPIEPCGDTDWGEVEDYTITITDPLGLGDNVIDFNIYPNPSEDIFNVDLSGFNGEATEIVITDITGRVISTINTPEQFMQLDLRDESKGIYFVTVYTENNAHTKKITKF